MHSFCCDDKLLLISLVYPSKQPPVPHLLPLAVVLIVSRIKAIIASAPCVCSFNRLFLSLLKSIPPINKNHQIGMSIENIPFAHCFLSLDAFLFASPRQ